jgi:hypothetical protein
MHSAVLMRVCTVFGLALCFGLPASADVVAPETAKSVDFDRHVMAIFSKMGCNAGSCHGSFQGKNGFRLSLFGYDADKDYLAVSRDTLGRRIDLIQPERSLLLLKATGQTIHEGGSRFSKDSWQYDMIRKWIAGGAARDASTTLTEINVTPSQFAVKAAGETGQIKVVAKYSDGTQENVTAFCDFRIQDDAVAEISPTGMISTRRPGDTAVVVLYRGQVRSLRILVPTTLKSGVRYPQTAESNYVDTHVFAKLRQLNMIPSDLSSDLEFLRRVTIDTIGCLPTPDEVRAFLADKSDNKREKKIDELLKHPMHGALWATKFSDVTGNNTDALENPQQLRTKLSQMWHDWLAKRFRDNTPYDEIVRGILTATSRDELSPEQWLERVKKLEEEMAKGFQTSYAEKATLDLFWRRQQQVPVETWGEKTAAAFLGVRLECAQCHKHPTDRWTQSDYRSFANIFRVVSVGQSPEAAKVINAENTARREKAKGKNNNQIVQVREMFVGTPRGAALTHPDTNRPLPAKTLGGPELSASSLKDARVPLFDWMRHPDNPFFARSFANRVWAHYFGVGIVDPVDDFSMANPPSNAPLLDALAADLIAGKFDVRKLEKAILMSRTYQLASKPNESNKHDRRNFSHSQIRPMMAEVVVDVLNSALDVNEAYGNDAPSGVRMIEVGSSRLQNANIAYALRIFGRPPRTTACDCERAMDPALPQTLYRMTDPSILTKLRSPNNRLFKMLREKKSDDEIIDELFLATLTRKPTDSEKNAVKSELTEDDNRESVFVNALWALINTREFILNH